MHIPDKSNQIESTIESFELRVVPNVENESNKHREIHKLASLLLIGSKHSHSSIIYSDVSYRKLLKPLIIKEKFVSGKDS